MGRSGCWCVGVMALLAWRSLMSCLSCDKGDHFSPSGDILLVCAASHTVLPVFLHPHMELVHRWQCSTHGCVSCLELCTASSLSPCVPTFRQVNVNILDGRLHICWSTGAPHSPTPLSTSVSPSTIPTPLTDTGVQLTHIGKTLSTVHWTSRRCESKL